MYPGRVVSPLNSEFFCLLISRDFPQRRYCDKTLNYMLHKEQHIYFHLVRILICCGEEPPTLCWVYGASYSTTYVLQIKSPVTCRTNDCCQINIIPDKIAIPVHAPIASSQLVHSSHAFFISVKIAGNHTDLSKFALTM